MDASPLIKAHDHARAAADATRSADSTVAINEHAQAAGEFSSAAKTTDSLEALRILRLLEQHHKRLSELLKFPLELASQQSNESSDGDEKHAKAGDGPLPSPRSLSGLVDAPATSPHKSKPTLAQSRRYPGRDLTSSIASNLANARGIKGKYRGQPLSPSISNDQAPGSLEVHPRRDGSGKAKALDAQGKPSWVPPTQGVPHKSEAHSSAPPSTAIENAPDASDDGFSRFYTTFGSIINRLSAPLAFAGLPLIAEDTVAEDAPTPSPEPTPKRGRARLSGSAGGEADLSKIFSKATLRAMRGDGPGNDSFYVVPTSGHTVSYANILTFAQKEQRRMAASIHGSDVDVFDDPDEDDFVDARESQAPRSPTLKKRVGKQRDMQNVNEELMLENKSLKEMLDKLSKRLHAFELNSQSSHLALAQSLRLQRPGSPTMSGSKGEPTVGEDGGAGLRLRNTELEEKLATVARQMDLLEKEHAKALQTLDKYRDRWEKLKAGAKARRDAQGTGEAGESSKTAR